MCGAITSRDTSYETRPVTRPGPFISDIRPDIKAFYDDIAVRQEYDLPEMDSFLANLEQTPKMLEPFSSYQYLYEYEHDDVLAEHLKRDVTGRGARHDPGHVQRMVYKSLEQHPEVLRVYMKGKV